MDNGLFFRTLALLTLGLGFGAWVSDRSTRLRDAFKWLDERNVPMFAAVALLAVGLGGLIVFAGPINISHARWSKSTRIVHAVDAYAPNGTDGPVYIYRDGKLCRIMPQQP